MDLSVQQRQIMLHELNPEIPIAANGKSNPDAQQAYEALYDKAGIGRYDDDKFEKTDAALTQAFVAKWNATHDKPIDPADEKAVGAAMNAVKAQDDRERADLKIANDYMLNDDRTNHAKWFSNSYEDQSAAIADGSISADSRRALLDNFKQNWNEKHWDKQISDNDDGSQLRARLKEVAGLSSQDAANQTIMENHYLERSGSNAYRDDLQDASKVKFDDRVAIHQAFMEKFGEAVGRAGSEKNALDSLATYDKANAGLNDHDKWMDGANQQVVADAQSRQDDAKKKILADARPPEEQGPPAPPKKKAAPSTPAYASNDVKDFQKATMENNAAGADGIKAHHGDDGKLGAATLEAMKEQGIDTSKVKLVNGLATKESTDALFADEKNKAIFAKLEHPDTPGEKGNPVVAKKDGPNGQQPWMNDPGISGMDNAQASNKLQDILNLDRAIQDAGLKGLFSGNDRIKFDEVVLNEEKAVQSGDINAIKNALAEHAQLSTNVTRVEDAVKTASMPDATPKGPHSIQA